MRRCRFDVVYLTDEPRREVERRLRSHCQGAWTLRANGRNSEAGQVHYTVMFERESDIASLCRPNPRPQ